MARCHRIGQSKNVTIYRLITRKSFEAEMFERASRKLGLEQAVLGTRQFNDQDVSVKYLVIIYLLGVNKAFCIYMTFHFFQKRKFGI
jgi:SNF2 family DNA or RNA helicase